MIFSEERTYGWGAGGILMPREVAGSERRRSPRPTGGALLKDLPWLPLLASLLLTITGMVALLFLEHHLPPVVPPKAPATVKITMRLPAEAPMPAVEPPVQREVRPPEKPRTARSSRPQSVPPPPPLSKPETATIPPPPPPQPVAAAKTPPPPSEKSKRVIPAELPPPPRREAVRQGREEAASLGPGPNLRPRAGRPAAEALPTASVTLGERPGLDVATADNGVTRPRYREERPEAAMPTAETRQTLAVSAGDVNPGAAPQLDRQRFKGKGGAAPALPAARTGTSFTSPVAAEVTPPPAASAARTGATAVAPLPAGAGGSFDFLDRLAASDLDRAHLVSLNRLRTCLDPGEEMKLRARLATLLSRPGTCRAGGVVFDIRQPESAWSIHVDIYNYEKRELQDRCAALRLAVSGCEGGRR